MMRASNPEAFPTIKLFMGGYWNQMGDEVYGTLAAALEQFSADANRTSEPKEYFAKLLLELREVRERGYALKLDGVETPEVWEFWRKAGGRGLSADDFDLIEAFLTKKVA